MRRCITALISRFLTLGVIKKNSMPSSFPASLFRTTAPHTICSVVPGRVNARLNGHPTAIASLTSRQAPPVPRTLIVPRTGVVPSGQISDEKALSAPS